MNTLGFNKKPSETTVVVAMSGGVDSSVVAGLLKQEGYNVIGITLQLYSSNTSAKKGSCCSGIDIYDARRVAQKLDIPHYVFNYEKTFKEDVIDYFINAYENGETPIPCVKCNETVKFRDLMNFAKKLEADCMATGHYIKRKGSTKNAHMYMAEDKSKDQSYFLFSTTQDQLDYLRFPLGDIPKDKTRKIAEDIGLVVFNKKDSQDICFIPDGDYKKFIKSQQKIGEIIDLDGNVFTGPDAAYITYFNKNKVKFLHLWYKEKAWFRNLSDFAYQFIADNRNTMSKITIKLFGKNPANPKPYWKYYLLGLIAVIISLLFLL